MTPSIQTEWNEHQSGFAKRWRATMVARKKLVIISVPEDPALRDAISGALSKAGDKKAALKDGHLLEAALATDKRIASLDEHAKSLFSHVAISVAPLADIAWINPAEAGFDIAQWLRDGAPTKGKTL